VFEDALAFIPDSFTVDGSGDTTYIGVRRQGRGGSTTERGTPARIYHGAPPSTMKDSSDRVVDTSKNAPGAIIDTMPLCSATENGQLVP